MSHRVSDATNKTPWRVFCFDGMLTFDFRKTHFIRTFVSVIYTYLLHPIAAKNKQNDNSCWGNASAKTYHFENSKNRKLNSGKLEYRIKRLLDAFE